jgi:DHA2 family multidrug resistance protein
MTTSITLPLKRPPDQFLYVALLCLTLMINSNQMFTLMSSPYIVGDLGGSNDTASYSVSFFSLGNALGIPLGRILKHRGHPARSLIYGILLFAFFSLMCAIAPNYPFFNAARCLQGFSCAPFYALLFHFNATLIPEEKRNLFDSINSSILTISPSIGSCFGGWIAYIWNWRFLFYFDIFVAILLALYLGYRLKGLDSQNQADQSSFFDFIGYVSFFIAVSCLCFVIITGQQLDWFRSPLIIILTILGILFFVYFIVWVLNHPDPILYLPLLKNPYFSFALLSLSILFSAYFGMVFLLSLWLKLWVSYTPDWIAILTGTMALSGLLPLFLIDEKKTRKIDTRIFLAIAIAFLAISCFHTMLFNIEINFGKIAFSRVLAGIGLAFFATPIARLSFHHFPRERQFHVLSLFQVFRALACGLGASIYMTIWQRRQIFYRDRLGSGLTVLSPETHEFFSKAEQVGLHGETADAQLDYYLQRESTSLALDDCFYLMGIILMGMLLVLALTLLLRRSGFIRSQNAS